MTPFTRPRSSAFFRFSSRGKGAVQVIGVPVRVFPSFAMLEEIPLTTNKSQQSTQVFCSTRSPRPSLSWERDFNSPSTSTFVMNFGSEPTLPRRVTLFKLRTVTAHFWPIFDWLNGWQMQFKRHQEILFIQTASDKRKQIGLTARIDHFFLFETAPDGRPL